MTRPSSGSDQEAVLGKGSPDSSAMPAATPGLRDINLEEPELSESPSQPNSSNYLT